MRPGAPGRSALDRRLRHRLLEPGLPQARALHQLKIDRSFIDGLPGDENDVAIVRARSSTSGALRLQVIAGASRRRRQRLFLQRAGCKPLPRASCLPRRWTRQVRAPSRSPRTARDMRLVNG